MLAPQLHGGPTSSNPGLSLFLPVVPGWSPPGPLQPPAPRAPPPAPVCPQLVAVTALPRRSTKAPLPVPPRQRPALKGPSPFPAWASGTAPSGLFPGVLVWSRCRDWTARAKANDSLGPRRLGHPDCREGELASSSPSDGAFPPSPSKLRARPTSGGTPCQGSVTSTRFTEATLRLREVKPSA